MNIILISNARKRCINISFRPLAVPLIIVCLVSLSSVIFYSGYHYAQSNTAEMLFSIQSQTASVWDTDIKQQKESLSQLRRTTEKSLDAISSRLSMLQSFVMRLDALGSRLAVMANFDDIEFGIDNPPGLGGPSSNMSEIYPSIPSLYRTFDELEFKLADRSEKLAAMESMLINRIMQEQTSPGGKPSLGGYLSSKFGYRTDPMTGKREFHEGLDFSGKFETPIVAVAAGIVTWSGPRFGYGNLVEISHGNGYLTRYAHNSKNLVEIGEKIKKGEVIALMGSSGRSTGTHVHFEVIHNGRNVDPRKYLALK